MAEVPKKGLDCGGGTKSNQALKKMFGTPPHPKEVRPKAEKKAPAKK